MAKFGIITCDEKSFVNDKIGFDFNKSFITPDETYATPISHEFSVDNITWINVTQSKMIDYAYTTAGTKTVYLRITSNIGTQVFEKTLQVLDLTSARLFSSDFDLVAYEPDIMKWLPKRWSSWNLIHLRAQDYIMNMLRERKVLDKNNQPYTVADIFDITEVRDLSAALVLRYIFSGTSNASDDVFKKKSDEYDALVSERTSKATLRLDYNKNAVEDEGELTDFRSVEIRRG